MTRPKSNSPLPWDRSVAVFPHGTALGKSAPNVPPSAPLGISETDILMLFDLMPPACAKYAQQLIDQMKSLFSGGATFGATIQPLIAKLPAVETRLVGSPRRQAITRDLLKTYTPRKEGLGTRADPHVYVAGVVDMLGPTQEERAAYKRVYDALTVALSKCSGKKCQDLTLARQMLRRGDMPFALVRNVGDNALWGKFYNEDKNAIWIDRVFLKEPISANVDNRKVIVDNLRSWYDPRDWPGEIADAFGAALEAIGDAIEWLGDAIIWVIQISYEALAWACDMYKKAMSSEAMQMARCAMALAGLLGEPTSATANQIFNAADKVCAAVTAVGAIFEDIETAPTGRRPTSPEAGADARNAERDTFEIIRATLLPVAIEPKYPVGAFGVYDPGIGAYRILVQERQIS